ncbi:FAD binding domain-containing protein [Pseudolysinimonas sp.]|uniref:FAD binding domain-containing protein n=1 Tax=Pseudolysinimonas sp. TaxID=2680009 RepID=UPI003F809377
MDLVDVESVRVARGRGDLALAPGERVLAGGTWLYSEPQPGVRGLVDLTGLGWPALEPLPDGGLRVGATCTLERLATADPAAGGHPLFAPAVDALLGSWKIHRVATVGGNICLALPAGPMTSLFAGLGADALIWMPDGGERREPVAELVTGDRTTALAPGEVLRALEVPAAALRARSALRRISLAELGRSGAVVVATVDDAGFTATVTAATPRPHRLLFPGIPTAAELADAVDAIGEWFDDPHGAPDWRHAMARLLAEELREELAA